MQLKNTVIFESKQVYLSPGANYKEGLADVLIPGVLRIIHNKYGPSLQWLSKDILNTSDGDWDLLNQHDDSNNNQQESSEKVEPGSVPKSPFVRISESSSDLIFSHSPASSDTLIHAQKGEIDHSAINTHPFVPSNMCSEKTNHTNNDKYLLSNESSSIINVGSYKESPPKHMFSHDDQFAKNNLKSKLAKETNTPYIHSYYSNRIQFELSDLKCYRCITPRNDPFLTKDFLTTEKLHENLVASESKKTFKNSLMNFEHSQKNLSNNSEKETDLDMEQENVLDPSSICATPTQKSVTTNLGQTLQHSSDHDDIFPCSDILFDVEQESLKNLNIKNNLNQNSIFSNADYTEKVQNITIPDVAPSNANKPQFNSKFMSTTQLIPPYYVFILKDGTTFPALQFRDNMESDVFVANLLTFLEIKRSYKENDMYMVKDNRERALEKSIHELQLSEEKGMKEDLISKFMKDPYTTTFTGFSKVAQFMYDNFNPVVIPSSQNGLNTALNQSILNPMNSDIKLLIENDNASMNGTDTRKNSQSCKINTSSTFKKHLDSQKEQNNQNQHNTNNHHGMFVNVLDLTPGESDFQLVDCNISNITSLDHVIPVVKRRSPLTRNLWTEAFDMENDGIIRNAQQIKDTIFWGGIQNEPNLRRDVWKYLLNYLPWDTTITQRINILKQRKDDYYRIKLQWKSIDVEQEQNFSKLRERKSLVEKDVHRTDRNHPYYSTNHTSSTHLTMEYDILMTYTMYNFDIGYVQGMSDILTPILYIQDNEVDAFWCFVGAMNFIHGNFQMDQEPIKLQLRQLYALLAFVDPMFAIYLDKHDSGNMYFCFRWLLIWFKREFTFDDILGLWEVLWTGLPCKNFHLIVCLAVLEFEKHTIMENRFGLVEILKHINDIANTLNLTAILESAHGIWQKISQEYSRNPNTFPTKIKNILGPFSFTHEISPATIEP